MFIENIKRADYPVLAAYYLLWLVYVYVILGLEKTQPDIVLVQCVHVLLLTSLYMHLYLSPKIVHGFDVYISLYCMGSYTQSCKAVPTSPGLQWLSIER